MKVSQKRAKSNKKTVLIICSVIAVVILGAGGVFAYQKISQHNQQKASPQTTASPSSGSSNTSSTSTDSQNSQGFDKTNDTGSQNSSSSSSSSTSSGNNTDIVIVDASQYDSTFEARAYAASIENGTCTYTFTKDSLSFTKTTAATAGPSTTSCATLDIPTDSFSQKGQWNLTVAYQSTSNSYSGKATQAITIK
jgi:cytoskeletal protein RodZ